MKTNNSYKYWIIVICCCGLAASSIGAVTNTLGVFYAPVSSGLGVLRGTFALSATMMTLATAFTSLPMAKILQKLPLKTVLLTGVILASVSTLLMGFSNNVYMFYALGITKGIGAALYGIIPITMIINHWFVKKHGMATSLVLSFSGVAGAVLSPILTSLINSFGWQNTYIILAVITLVLALPAIIYPFKLYPDQEGMIPYGGKRAVVQDNKTTTSSFNPKSATFMLFLFACILLTAITGMPSHLPGYGESVKAGASVGALMLSACMIGNILSKLVIGVLSDILGAIKSVYVMIFINLISILMLLFVHSDLVLIASSVLFGSIYGVCAVGIALMTKHFFGEANYPKAYSIVSFATNFGAAFAMTLIGFIYDIFNSYSYALIIALAFLLVNVVILGYLNKNNQTNN